MKLNVWVVFLGLFGVAAVFSYSWNPGTNVGFLDGASVIAFVSMMAVAIERILEFFWGLVGGTKGLGGYWPLSAVVKRAREIEDQANTLVSDATFGTARTILEHARDTFSGTAEDLRALQAHLDGLEPLKARLAARLTEVKSLAPGSTRVALASGVAADAQAFLSNAATRAGATASSLKTAVDAAGDAVNLAVGIVSSFQENPARRTASLLLGTTMGMFAAGFVGLNMFSAILTDSAAQATGAPGSILFGSFGVLLTGFVIGLGSNPTHEVVKALQNYKKSRQDSTVAEVTIDAGVGHEVGSPAADGHEAGTRSLVVDAPVQTFGITGPHVSAAVVTMNDTRQSTIRRRAFVRLRSTD